MRVLVICATWFLFLLVGRVSAHEHWLDIGNFQPAAGEKARILICSGHTFPKSTIILRDRLLHSMEVIRPDGKAVAYQPTAEKTCWAAEFSLESAGAYIITFSLKKPQLKEPLYWAKAILIVGAGEDNENLYTVGKGLEIVPGRKLSELKKGETMPLTVFYNGSPVDASLSILPEAGKIMFLSTSSDRPAVLKIAREGRYLVTASYGGKGCALTFAVPKAGDTTE